MKLASRLSLALFALACASACRNQNTVVVPNRVLDRPLDMTLACVEKSDDRIVVRALNDCVDQPLGHCLDEDTPQLIGFIANSEKNEVGMFRRCDTNGMVDLDPEAPGYNLVPVGTTPSRIVQTPDCRVVTANYGSCDLSAIEMPDLAAYAVGLPPDEAPSSLVSTIVPRRSDGTPLGARPGDMIAVPRELSLADDGDVSFGDTGTDESGGAESSGGDTNTVETDGADGFIGGACDPEASASVYVTFPQCQLVAEISLDTQRVLQSRQFVLDDNGEITIVDSGPDPVCPIECPAQFDGDIPDIAAPPDGGVFPIALALVEGEEGADSHHFELPSLFVGGSDSDEIFEILLESDGALGFAPPEDTLRLLLEEPAGVVAIRPTPIVSFEFEEPHDHQFLYVIAGDGSTHVVDRNTDETELGVECDTQVDPSQATSRACHPIDPGSQGGQAERRPFAAGPGIRTSEGSSITDWTFEIAKSPQKGTDRTRAPFGDAGVVGIGVTSFGRVVLAVFTEYDDAPTTISVTSDGRKIDPIGLLNVEVRPHMLWPVTDPSSGEPSVLPLVNDEPPNRVIPAEDQVTQVLAPTLRRVDYTYFATSVKNEFSNEQRRIWEALGQPTNADRLSGFDDSLYESFPARVAVRDYRQWRGDQVWQLLWEPAIPGTEGTTGRVVCEDPSDYGGGTCQVSDGQSVSIVDEGATFCDEGVLPGDKLVLFGCGTDDECGAGRRCLRDPTAPGSSSGICVSASAYENNLEQLRQYCAPFIADPCGAPRREYLVTSATQTEVGLAAMDIPAVTFMRHDCPLPAGPDNLRDPLGPKPTEPVDACVDRLPIPAGGCDGAYSEECAGFCYPKGSDCGDDRLGLQECEARLTCVVPPGQEQPSGGCTSDAECADLGANGEQYICFDSVCRTPCEGGSFNCRQALLPGPGCFGEFVRYAVATRESFVVGLNPAQQFITDRVITDPETGECREDPTVSNLLTSRLRLGADEAATFANIPACPNADEASPADPNPCRIMTQRSDPDGELTLYHAFSYDEEPVEALRFSNPYGTIVIDLVSLLDLASPTELLEAGTFPACYARFRRARIPRNYREEFGTPQTTGYAAFNDPIVVGNTPLTYPVRVVPAPETGVAFAVDAGGRGGVTGVRGQVVRLTISQGSIRGDEQFRVR